MGWSQFKTYVKRQAPVIKAAGAVVNPGYAIVSRIAANTTVKQASTAVALVTGNLSGAVALNARTVAGVVERATKTPEFKKTAVIAGIIANQPLITRIGSKDIANKQTALVTAGMVAAMTGDRKTVEKIAKTGADVVRNYLSPTVATVTASNVRRRGFFDWLNDLLSGRRHG